MQNKNIRENYFKNNIVDKKINKNKKIKNILKYFAFFVFIFSIIFYFFSRSPNTRNEVVKIKIEKGDSLYDLSKKLKKEKLIKSEIVFKVISKLRNIEKKIHIGKYKIDKKDSAFDIVSKIKKGEVVDESVKIIIFEGWPNYKIADSLEKKLSKNKESNFSKNIFLEIAKNKEGYLYPDTYKIDPTWSEEKIVNLFYKNYKKKIKKYLPYFEKDLQKFGKTEREILIMASIVEAEAGNVAQREKKMVAGILWNRINQGMPLQADAVFSYIKQDHIDKVMFKNLDVESKYNVYKNKGLPPGPIGNPGLAAIRGALLPQKTDYLFYLTDDKLKFHYAISYRKHLENIKKYLRK